MKTVILIVTLSALLSACTAMSPVVTAAYAAPSDISQIALASDDDDETAAAKQANAGLPSVELSEELLFKLLAAEIAFQRGGWQAGYVNMLAAAQETRDPRLARRAVEMAIAAKQTDEALAATRLWRALAPKSDEATQYYLGLILLGDDLSEVQEVFEQRLRDVRPPSRGILLLQIQRLLLRAKDKTAAFKVMEALVEPYSSLSEAHIALAQAAFANNDLARARSEAGIAIRAKPDSEIAELTLAQVMSDKKEVAQSLQAFLASYPKSREVRIAYARLLIEENQYAKARAEFEILLKSQPKDLTTLFALGVLSTQTNDMKGAEQYLGTYLKVLAAHPEETRDPAQALLLLAQIAEERKDTGAALDYLSRIVPGESWLGAQIKRAQLIARNGNVPAAQKILAGLSVDSEPEKILLIQAEAQILRDANMQQQADQTIEAGLKHFPDNTDLLYDFAMAAEKADRLDTMETALRKVIKLAPSNQHAYNALGYSLAERNIRLPEAVKLIEQALSLAPEDPFIMDSMGWVQYRLGKLSEAEDLLRRAYQLRPDAEIAVHLGEVLWVRGQKEDARKFWRDARTKDPKNDTLKNTLTRLQVPQ
ncbi:tetratricopeptide repeat protein [Actimicrobium sp. GrIS 1.19]|uniref:tetratricopeptide repeat protein n=1 Tax=Actimicrobium sp. GrIS 1.19 TaxID=3071708 RepID=UPI002E0E5BC8